MAGFLLRGEYCAMMRYHGEFLLMRHVIILDSNLLMSCLKGTMR